MQRYQKLINIMNELKVSNNQANDFTTIEESIENNPTLSKLHSISLHAVAALLPIQASLVGECAAIVAFTWAAVVNILSSLLGVRANRPHDGEFPAHATYELSRDHIIV